MNGYIDNFLLNGCLVPSRCTDSFIDRRNLRADLDLLVSKDFGTVSERIKHLLYGGGYCQTCGVRTNLNSSGRGFTKYCKKHAHDGKRGKVSHNNKIIDADIKTMYADGMSVLEISKTVGNVSNVTIKNKLDALGTVFRTHSENQTIHHYVGPYKGPIVVCDRAKLVEMYNQKVPMQTLADSFGCHVETIRRFLIQEGVERFHRTTQPEYVIKAILDELGVEYISNSRSVINPLEIDFFIPSHNVGIEVNGLYHHSLYSGKKPIKYHQEKYKMCQDKGVRLFQFWDSEILGKEKIVRNIIKNAIGLTSEKIDARKCEIRGVSRIDADNFLTANHIQGKSSANDSIGLYYNNSLMGVMCVGKYKDFSVILRYCTTLGTNLRGGFSKLLNTIRGSVKTYSSNMISNGDLYLHNGFLCTSENIDMWYTDYKQLFNRRSFQKNILAKKLQNFDPMKTEIENMIRAGYDVVYGAGIKTWIKN